MSFAGLANKDLNATLTGMIDSGRVPHAILFHEEDGGGAFPLCMAFLKYLYCGARTGEDACGACPSCNKISKLIHPDIHFIFPTAASALSVNYLKDFRALAGENPDFTESELNAALKIEGKNSLIAVAEAKRLLEVLSLSALEGGYRSVVIYLPEKMNAEAANKLLKIIEEPPVLTQFLLITHKPEKVLTTISSRCQRIRVRPRTQMVQGSEFDQPELFADLMSAMVAGDLLASLEAAEAPATLSREAAKSFCRYASEQCRKIFFTQQGVGSLVSADPQIASWAAACPKTFPRKALAILDKAHGLIDRNVNLKILFTDVCDRLYLEIRKK